MAEEYSQTLELDFWLVHKEHLERIFNLFLGRFDRNKNRGTIELTLRENNVKVTKNYHDFKTFDKNIRDIISLKCTILDINFIFSHHNPISFVQDKFASLGIRFQFNSVHFYVAGIGGKQIKDWIFGFNNEMQTLFNSFRPASEIIDKLKSQPANKYKTSIIILDYDNIQGNKIILPNVQPTKKWYKDPYIIVPAILTILAAIIGLIWWWLPIVKQYL